MMQDTNKPMIRHCRNCQYSKSAGGSDSYCDVKYQYKYGNSQRLVALLCKFYKQRGETK